MTRLSVNLNKAALMRNARGGGRPDVGRLARVVVAAGAVGVTLHPRPDGATPSPPTWPRSRAGSPPKATS